MKYYTRQEIDSQTLQIVSDLKNKETELIEKLQLVEKLRIYDDFKLGSLYAYCTQRLGLSEDRACTYIRVAQVAKKIPAVREAIACNELSVSAALKLAPVIKIENQEFWLEKAKSSSTRELQMAIATEKPETMIRERVKPVAENLFELRCALSPKAERLLVRALDLLSSKRNKAVKQGEAIEAVLEAFIEKHDPLKKAERAMKRKTKKVSVALRIAKPGKRTPIPRPVGHIVSLQTGEQCTEVDAWGNRCASRRWLAKHHKTEVQHGGLHTPENLTKLCSSHHRLIHKNGIPWR